MAHPLPLQGSAQALRARQNKALLLPIPRAVADGLSLLMHVQLEALRTGHGWIEGAQRLTEVMLLASFLAEAGFGPFSNEALVTSDAEMAATFEQGRQTGRWILEPRGYELFAAIVTLHDWQLRSAPMSALSAASERLERFKAGEQWRPTRKRA
jgi:hypothetical protein